MLVKIVNLTDNRFKNCRSSNFSDEYATFGINPSKAGGKGREAAKPVVEVAKKRSPHMDRLFAGYEKAKAEGRVTDKTPPPIIEAGKAESD